MAPGRKRGANKAKAKSQLSFGDLVLAKVKGFPFWPAKVCRPEDFKRSPDPKKHFVNFFGTQEIAWVGPSDIQVFTSEVKIKLSSKLPGKSKIWAQSVNEICAEFEKLQNEKSSALGASPSADGAEGGGEVDLNDGIAGSSGEASEDACDVRYKVDDCSRQNGEANFEDTKPFVSCHARDSPVQATSSDNRSGNEQLHDVISVSGFPNDGEDETSAGGKQKVDVDQNENKSEVDISQFSRADGEVEERRITSSDTMEMEDVKCGVPARSGKQSKDREKEKPTSAGINDAFVGSSNGKKGKVMQKAKTNSKSADGICESIVDKKTSAQPGLCKSKVVATEASRPFKRLKSGDVKSPEESLDADAIDVGLSNSSSLHEKAEVRKGLKGQTNKAKDSTSAETGKAKFDALPAPGKVKLDASAATVGVKSVASAETDKVKYHASRQMDKVKSSSSVHISKLKSDSSAQRRKVTGDKGKGKADVKQTRKLNDTSSDEDVLPVSKRRRRAPEAMSDSAHHSNDRKERSLDMKNDLLSSNPKDHANLKLKRRRAVCLYDEDEEPKTPVHCSSAKSVKPPSAVSTASKKKDRAVCLYDEDEEPKTPVHGGSARSVKPSSAVSSVSKKRDIQTGGSHIQKDGCAENSQSNVRESTKRHATLKEASLHVQENALSPEVQRTVKTPSASDSQSPREDKEQVPAKETITVLTSPNNSPLPRAPPKTIVGKHKTSKAESQSPREDEEQVLAKETNTILTSPNSSPRPLVPPKTMVGKHKTSKAVKTSSGTQKKPQVASGKHSGLVLDVGKSSQSRVAVQSDRHSLSAEGPKSTPKVLSSVGNHASLLETQMNVEAAIDDASISVVDFRTPDSSASLKHLIAAAQAKRKEAHSQHFSLRSSNYAFMPINDAHGWTPSPTFVHPSQSTIPNVMQADASGLQPLPDIASPSTQNHLSDSQNQTENGEAEERRVSSGNRAPGGSLSGGTEAAVTRDAFEGMIETLSRTKESIARATRLAIDCAKYGIANEVVELLIRKLESESSFHRKVDLFFLVDSITQCSHNQKGIAGASYVPTVQAALSRLLAAAAPPGAGARENRRQCLKVLRLWVERKIFPESALKHFMDDIGGPRDVTSCGVSLRRPSRNERALNDPIREMEGMHVDEYGSNATFQLPGFLPGNIFEDDEDLVTELAKEAAMVVSVAEPDCALGELETNPATPSDRRHCILEDVDGELEMEDVSGHHLKDEEPELAVEEHCYTRADEPASNSFTNSPPLPDGSPPLPPGSPPELPPLPPSPPLSFPPTPSFPSQLPPPPPPLPPPSQLPVPSLLPPTLPSGPQPSLSHQQTTPTQPSLHPQSLMSTQPSLQSPQLGYQQAVPHEYGSKSGGNQMSLMANAPHVKHMDQAVKSDVFPQQSPCFAPSAVCNSRETQGFNSSRHLDFSNNDLYLNPQASHQNPQFQQGNSSFISRPVNPSNLQMTAGHFQFTKPMIQQHHQQSYSHPYPVPSLPEGHRRFVGDDQWRMPLNEFNANNPHGGWTSRRTPSHAGHSIGQEGFFRAPIERPSANSVGMQYPANNNLPVAPPLPHPSHGVSPLMPCRPDMSALNCWRPA